MRIKLNLVKLDKEVILQVLEQDKVDRIDAKMAGKIVEIDNKDGIPSKQKFCFIFGGHSYPEIRTGKFYSTEYKNNELQDGYVIYLGGSQPLPKKTARNFSSNDLRDEFYDDFLKALEISSNVNLIPTNTIL